MSSTGLPLSATSPREDGKIDDESLFCLNVNDGRRSLRGRIRSPVVHGIPLGCIDAARWPESADLFPVISFYDAVHFLVTLDAWMNSGI